MPLASADPAFVASAYIPESLGSPIGDDDKIYFFFSETGQEFEFFENTIVSRVARVCKVSWGSRVSTQSAPTSVTFQNNLPGSRSSTSNQSVSPLPPHPCPESGVCLASEFCVPGLSWGVSGLWVVGPRAELVSPCYAGILFCFLVCFGFSRQCLSV